MQLGVGSADDERRLRDAVRYIEQRRRAAGGEREIFVHHMEGVVVDDDIDNPIGAMDGTGEVCAAGVALELEGRGPARRLAGLLQPERVGDGHVAA